MPEVNSEPTLQATMAVAQPSAGSTNETLGDVNRQYWKYYTLNQ